VPGLVDPVIPAVGWGERPQPILAGDGLRLRPWQPGDEDFLVEAYADPQIRFWHGLSLADRAEASGLIARRARAWPERTGADWAVTDGSAVLGRVGLRTLDLEQGEGEVAYWVAPSARGRRTACRAVGLLTGWARDSGLHRLTLQHSTRNAPSCRVAARAGFRVEGTALRSVRHTDGFHDMHLHALLLD